MLRKYSQEYRAKYGRIAGIFGIVTKLILFFFKIGICFLSNSLAIIADAINNLSDSISSILTLVGFQLAKRKADKEHPFGHARYEYVTGILISFLVFLMAYTLLKNSILKIMHPEILTITMITYFVLILAIVGKLLQMVVYFQLSKKIDSSTIKANAIDARNDAICTSVVFLSIFFMKVFQLNIDGYMSFFVSLFLLYSSILLIKETIDPLLGLAASKEQVNFIKQNLLKYKEIKGFHDLILHNYGPSKIYATVHIEVDEDMNLLKADQLMDKIEKDFEKKLGVHITTHIDPISKKDRKLEEKIENIMKKMDTKISIHDFKVIEKKKMIFFDVVLPYDKNYSIKRMIELLKKEIADYDFEIQIDHPYY